MLRPAWGEFHPEPGICRLGKEKEKFTSIGGGSMLTGSSLEEKLSNWRYSNPWQTIILYASIVNGLDGSFSKYPLPQSLSRLQLLD